MKRPDMGMMWAALLLTTGCGGGESGDSVASAAGRGKPVTTSPTPTPTPTPSPTPSAGASAISFGVATHFQQGWPISALDTARQIGATTVRDEIAWKDVERTSGTYDFSATNVRYLDDVNRAGLAVTLLLQGGNPLYDQGYTPYTDASRAAFARYVVAVLDRFPSVSTIEIGNEFNAQNFVTGPVQSAGYPERQAYYAKLLKAVYDAVKARHPDVKVLGGAAHSIPVGYYKALFDAGALSSMDGLVIHPYTTEPEQFAKQIAILRGAMGTRPLPIHVTEFAREVDSAAETAAYLVKMTAALAEAKVASADWYALRQEGPVNAPWYKQVGLSRQDGTLTDVGRAYRMMAARVLAAGPAQRVSVDDFTYAYLFGDRTMVIWGAPRDLSFDGTAQFLNTRGEDIGRPTQIDPNEPIVIVASQPIVLGSNLRLGTTSLVADSFDQFDYTYARTSNDAVGRWSYYDYSVSRKLFEPLTGLGGGEISASAWTPYISDLYRRPLGITAESLTPANFGSDTAPNSYRTVLRYVFDADQRVQVSASWDIAAASTDGVDITIALNGATLESRVAKGVTRSDLRDIVVHRGDRIDFLVGPNISASGDSVRYRVKISR